MRPVIPGIYVPLPTFFQDDEELDLVSYKKHVQFTAKAGVLPVVCGSMGEAVHLTHPERISLIKAAREALDEAGLTQIPILAGAGAASTRETIILAKEAAEAGADHVIVVPCGYYAGALTQANSVALKQFYVDVAKESPLPVMMYNFPGVAGGIDMNSDLIEDIAKSAPNTCGIKLTCGAVGKLTRVAALTTDPSFTEQYPRKNANAPFLVLDGFIDFLLPSIAAGSSGAITGVPNFAPNVCMRLWNLCLTDPGSPEARSLQTIVSRADWAASNANIPGMKRLLHELFGYGRMPRRPLLPMTDANADAFLCNPHIQAILDLEREIVAKSQ